MSDAGRQLGRSPHRSGGIANSQSIDIDCETAIVLD
jgi:hypothetical protein